MLEGLQGALNLLQLGVCGWSPFEQFSVLVDLRDLLLYLGGGMERERGRGERKRHEESGQERKGEREGWRRERPEEAVVT